MSDVRRVIGPFSHSAYDGSPQQYVATLSARSDIRYNCLYVQFLRMLSMPVFIACGQILGRDCLCYLQCLRLMCVGM